MLSLSNRRLFSACVDSGFCASTFARRFDGALWNGCLPRLRRPWPAISPIAPMKLQWWITPIQCLCKSCRRIALGNDESVIAVRHQENIGFEVKAGSDVFRDLMPRRDSHQIPDLGGQGAEFALAVSKKKGPTQSGIGAAMPKECRQGDDMYLRNEVAGLPNTQRRGQRKSHAVGNQAEKGVRGVEFVGPLQMIATVAKVVIHLLPDDRSRAVSNEFELPPKLCQRAQRLKVESRWQHDIVFFREEGGLGNGGGKKGAGGPGQAQLRVLDERVEGRRNARPQPDLMGRAGQALDEQRADGGGERIDTTDPNGHALCAADTANALDHLVGLREQFLRVFEQALPGGSRLRRTGAAVEQRRPEESLQLLDPLGDGGLRDIQQSRRLGDAAGLHDSNPTDEQVPIRLARLAVWIHGFGTEEMKAMANVCRVRARSSIGIRQHDGRCI